MARVQKEKWTTGIHVVARDNKGHILASKKLKGLLPTGDIKRYAVLYKQNNTFDKYTAKYKTAGGLTGTIKLNKERFKKQSSAPVKIERPIIPSKIRVNPNNNQRMVQYIVEGTLKDGSRISRTSGATTLEDFNINSSHYRDEAWEYFLEALADETGNPYDKGIGEAILEDFIDNKAIKIREGIVSYK